MMTRAITPEEICRKLKPVFGKKIDQLYMQYSLADDRETREQLERGMKVLYEKFLNTTLLSDAVLLEPPAAETIKGTYPLGLVTYAGQTLCPFGLREQDWIRHVCVTGMSGSGKTNFAYHVAGNFIRQKKPFLVFDWKKSFRPLMKLDRGILCFTIGNNRIANLFRFNILRPPKGVAPKEWIATIADLITESFFASYGVHKILVETIDRAYKDFGVYAGTEHYPTWYQIRDRLEQKAKDQNGSRRGGEWLESALRIAHALTYGPFGEVVCTKDEYGLKVEDLLNRKVIFELNSLSNAEKKFFCEFVLLYLYKYLKANQFEAQDQFKFAIIVDEAHNVFLKDRPNFMRETVTDMVYREIREYGASLVCLDQHISKLSDTVAGNSATNIAFQQVLPQDVDTVASLMQLREHRQYYSMLPVGHAIVKLAERYHLPFLMKVPKVELKQSGIRDEDLRRRMKLLVSDDRKLKQVMHGAKAGIVAAELRKVERIFEETGVALPHQKYKGYVEAAMYKGKEADRTAFEAARVAQDAQDEHDGKNQKAYPANHVQADLVDLVLRQRVLGMDYKDIKILLIKAGYGRADVLKAVKLAKQGGDAEPRTAPGAAIRDYLKGNPAARKFVQLVSEKPQATTAVYKALKLSARKGTAIKKELESLGLIGVRDHVTAQGKKRLIFAEKTAALVV